MEIVSRNTDTFHKDLVYYLGMVKKLYTNSELIRAQRSSINNRDHLMRSVSCGCYSCETIMLANDIRDWKLEEDGGMTAICPFCGKATIIGDSGIPMKKIFLQEMRKFWAEQCR